MKSIINELMIKWHLHKLKRAKSFDEVNIHWNAKKARIAIRTPSQIASMERSRGLL